MSEIHRRRPWLYKCEFSFVRNDRRPSQKSGTRRENINAPDSPDLTPSIPDALRYLRFLVFISRQNLGQSGNSKISDRLGFSRHMKTRLKMIKSDMSDCISTWFQHEISALYDHARQNWSWWTMPKMNGKKVLLAWCNQETNVDSFL